MADFSKLSDEVDELNKAIAEAGRVLSVHRPPDSEKMQAWIPSGFSAGGSVNLLKTSLTFPSGGVPDFDEILTMQYGERFQKTFQAMRSLKSEVPLRVAFCEPRREAMFGELPPDDLARFQEQFEIFNDPMPVVGFVATDPLFEADYITNSSKGTFTFIMKGTPSYIALFIPLGFDNGKFRDYPIIVSPVQSQIACAPWDERTAPPATIKVAAIEAPRHPLSSDPF